MWTRVSGRLRIVAFLVFFVITVTQARAEVLYVDAAATGAGDGSSWTDAYVYLQDALAAAAQAGEPVEIRVAQGTYKPDQGAGVTLGDIHAAFKLVHGLELRGGYAGVAGAGADERDPATYITTLSGDLNDDDPTILVDQADNSLGVVVIDVDDAVVVIDGVHIVASATDGIVVEGSRVTVSHCVFEDHSWSAVSGSDCQLVVKECLFQNNGWSRAGGPVIRLLSSSVNYTASDVEVADCVFRENPAGGIRTAGTLDLNACSFAGNGGRIVYCLGTLTAKRCTFNTNVDGTVIDCQADTYRPEVRSDCTLVDCDFVNNSDEGVVHAECDSLTAIRCVFSGNLADSRSRAGAITSNCTGTSLSNCLFAGNESRSVLGGSGAVSTGLVTQVSNCTFVGNRGEPDAISLESGVTITQCIVWNHADAFGDESGGTVTYSDIEGGCEGQGNIDVDPCFVDPGYWETNGTPEDETDDRWVLGDYHLKSQAGHWDSQSRDWVLDETTSACIDAGDPNGPINAEPFPNGGYVNLGAYGATPQASRTYFGGSVCETQIAGDINGDCKVDDLDMDILLSHWLMPDIGRVNTPPTVRIINPTDGAELGVATPVTLQAEACDPDGTVLRVEYILALRSGASLYLAYQVSYDPTDNWARDLAYLSQEGAWTVWAKAVDNEGATTISEPITITRHP